MPLASATLIGLQHTCGAKNTPKSNEMRRGFREGGW
jgi:hypothetical protein